MLIDKFCSIFATCAEIKGTFQLQNEAVWVCVCVSQFFELFKVSPKVYLKLVERCEKVRW